MNTGRITTFLLGPELCWLLTYGLALLLVAPNQPPTEAGNVRLESLAWYVLLAAIVLSFLPLYWSQSGFGWWMLRIGIAGLIGITSVATAFCAAIDYNDSRNSGVGTLWIMLVTFGVIFLFLGMIGAGLLIKFRTYALPVVKWAGIGLGVLAVLWMLINLIAKAK
ncbi:hypothetical protein SAMN05216327_105270 [Dyadobacter sp. SG02]|uniref:hypothetical protein n=1 Tax=Dyadobacter sp. SG02 TaxID=1855291 RepID=UPI0008C36BD0|nr:hypothetical protein [Dyadobacter sp. SG02]SEJ01240.1 hypothetical protein SAMN05216327_105270 [Dyadobacter sp. SG02]